MAGLKKTAKGVQDRGHSIWREATKGNPLKAIDDVNPVKGFEETGEDAVSLFEPDVPTPEEETIIPIPDQNTSALEAKKRRARASRTGRDSTILTEGLGG